MPSVERRIWNKFGIRTGDMPPYWSDKGYRAQLCELFAELGFKKGAEIGVAGGDFSRQICQANPSVSLLCVDPWMPYHDGPVLVGINEAYFERAKKRLQPYNVDIRRMPSQEVASTVPNGSLDFIYIDACHDFDHAMMDLLLWCPKVRYEGIIAGHDFAEGCGYGVVQAVYAYTQAHAVRDWYVTSAIYGRQNRGVNKEAPSFFWVQREHHA